MILVAIAGIGGFARQHHRELLNLEKAGVVRLVAACDPGLPTLGSLVEEFAFAARGVDLYEDFALMLDEKAGRLGLVILCTPIHTHAQLHALCVARGIPCYLEKPPTLDPEELESMIGRDEAAEKSTQVGFNYLAQASRIQLKRRILDDEFGSLQCVSFVGLWQRAHSYYQRNNWAGCLQRGEALLLDSCCGNAMAHHIHNLLFFAGGEDVMHWAGPRRVESELYRANAIEGADTVFARGQLDNDVEFRIAASHACRENVTREILSFDKAVIEVTMTEITIRYYDGAVQTLDAGPVSLGANIRAYLDYVKGTRKRPLTRLSECRPFVALNALLYVAAGGIAAVLPPCRQTETSNDGLSIVEIIEGIEDFCGRFVGTPRFPSECSLPWGISGGEASINHIGNLRKVITRISQSRENLETVQT